MKLLKEIGLSQKVLDRDFAWYILTDYRNVVQLIWLCLSSSIFTLNQALIEASSIEHGGTSAIFILMVPLAL